ncbi:glycine--tRNA ligase subunit beta [uncultured Erythrobacter sp.]|uniref:glycine--tRNA ligase subunit beta n=1 Tax=uncultured Erythrobacter sp. TaxID=263913 RepID=UPI002618B9E5|nr:glycine--tRNA ligase subunit beta [uncultured Erythrobacter sp.]
MADFLLELLTEEIPARMQKGARAELEKLFTRELSASGVAAGDITVWSTPRRLALIARDLPTETEAVREEAKGPPAGAPDQAVDGFCRKSGVTRDQLEEREVKGRATYFAVIEKPGQQVADLLATVIPYVITQFSWPKSMRWGAASITSESLRWVRPLSGIVALLDGDVIEFELPSHADVYSDASGNLEFKKVGIGLSSGRTTMGHRFHSNGLIGIDDADDYAPKLRAAHVIVDQEERAGIIREGAKKAAKAAGLTVVADEGLVVENAGLTEWPAPLLGRFDESFLDVPPEVIQLTARVNQKYFVCEDAAKNGGGKLANAFICTANIDATDPAVVVDGNRKVLAARLADARFFWELDQKTTLADHAMKLERITFHEKLGTVADKVERVAKLARWLCEEGIVTSERFPAKAGTSIDEAPDSGRSQPSLGLASEELADLAEQAARLCKADLVTEMVGEFPELQGLMGGYYAEKEGLPQEVSDAIRDHYKPVGQGDDVPTAPVTVAVSLADKLDTLLGFFQIDEKPTGSKDPFALRRAALGVLRLLLDNDLRASMRDLITQAAHPVGRPEAGREVASFLIERLKVQQRESGVGHDMIDAVAAVATDDDMARMVMRTNALQSFIETDNGANLLAGYKRAANILKKEEWEAGATNPAPEPAEAALIAALDTAEPKAASAIEAEDFEAAMEALASLRAPIDAFFEGVTVNDQDTVKRDSRLGLLARLRSAVHKVADFSRIEG